MTPARPHAPGLETTPADVSLTFAAVWLLVCFGLAYLPDIGRGFISDDYGWIAHSRIRTPGDLLALFGSAPTGFYRPLVSLTFSVDQAWFGLWPFGYALTNLGLALAVAAAIAHLVTRLGFAPGAGLFAAGLWAFNLHGPGMALTWISGRTSLVDTLFAVLAAIAVMGGHRWLAGFATLASLLAKETPVMLPVVLLLWAVLDGRQQMQWRTALGAAFGRTWPCLAALAVYLALRQRTPAFTPQAAPPYYALSLSPAVLGPNTLHYLDRSLTVTVAVLLLGMLLFVRRAPRLDPHERRAVVKAAIWFLLGSIVTLMVPVRSSLYALLPSVGASILGAAVGTALWRMMRPAFHRRAILSLLLLTLALVPVYRARNAPARGDAELSARLAAVTTDAVASRPMIDTVEIFQAPGDKPSARSAVGTALPLAVRLMSGRTIEAALLEVLPGDEVPPSDTTRLRLLVRGGEVTLP